MAVAKTNFGQRLAFILLIIMLALLPFHAFIYTWIKSYFWTDSWTIIIHVWKEILVIVLGLLGIGEVISKRSQLPHGRGNALAYLYLGLALLHFALFTGDNVFQAAFGLRTAAVFVILFLVVQLFNWTKENFRQLLLVALVVGSITALFGILQTTVLPANFLTNFGYSQVVSSWDPQGNLPAYHQLGDAANTVRAQATFAQPNRFAAYLLLIFFPLFFFATKTKPGWRRQLAQVASLVVLFALFFTYSRGAWLSLALALAYFFWRKYGQRISRRSVIIGITVLLLVGGAILAGLPQSQQLQETILRQGSTSAHVQRTLSAIQVGLQHPFGLGLGQAGGTSMRFDPTGQGFLTENFYLQILVEQGYLSFLAFLFLIVYLVLHLLKEPQKTYYLGYSFLALALANLFTETFDDTAVVLSTFALLGIAWQQLLPVRS